MSEKQSPANRVDEFCAKEIERLEPTLGARQAFVAVYGGRVLHGLIGIEAMLNQPLNPATKVKMASNLLSGVEELIYSIVCVGLGAEEILNAEPNEERVRAEAARIRLVLDEVLGNLSSLVRELNQQGAIHRSH